MKRTIIDASQLELNDKVVAIKRVSKACAYVTIAVSFYYQSGKSHGTSTFNSLGYSLDCHYSIIQLQLTGINNCTLW